MNKAIKVVRAGLVFAVSVDLHVGILHGKIGCGME